MSYEIITDSCCNLAGNMIDDLGLHIIPYPFVVDGVEYHSYLKGEQVDLKQFYDMMREGKVITTSQPNLLEVETLFRSILDRGVDVLYLGFSSGQSSTYGAVENIGTKLSREYPERTIRCVDTLCSSVGEGLIVYLACQKKEAGFNIDQLATWVEQTRGKIAHWFTVDDLMFLYRGGRLSRTSAFAGTLLNIKPVLHVDYEGKLAPVAKTRGRKKSIQALVKHMEETVIQPVKDQTIAFTHADCPEDLEYLKSLVFEKFGKLNYISHYIDPVIGAHCGPGTLAVFFMAHER